MSETATNRLPPRVLQVLSPTPNSVHPALVGLLVVICVAVGLIILFVATQSELGAIGYVLGPVMLALAVVGGIGLPLERLRQRAKWESEVAALHARCPEYESDPTVAEIRRQWKLLGVPPRNKAIMEAAAAGERAIPARGQVVCLGAIEVPQVGDLRFEPYIITATELMWRRLAIVPLAVLLLAIWWLQYRSGRRIDLWLSAYVISGAAFGVAWFLRAMVYPTYIRIAPGIIQVMEYGLGRSRPVTRTYAMESGTHVIVRRDRAWLRFMLARGKERYELQPRYMRRRQQATEQIWQALLSTAPIPPMSRDDLVG